MISMKDYALKHNISYEAVRKQVKRYQNELQSHIHKVGRTNYLDEEAEAFLDDKREKNPVVVVEDGRKDEIQRLHDENKALLLKITELQSLLIDEKENVQQLQAALIQEKEQVKQLQSQLVEAVTKTNQDKEVAFDDAVSDEGGENVDEVDQSESREEESGERELTWWQRFKSWWL